MSQINVRIQLVQCSDRLWNIMLRARESLTFTGSLVLLAVISAPSFGKNIGYLFPGGDGSYALAVIAEQRLWFPLSFGFSGEMLQGLGDIAFPMNPIFEPAYQFALLPFGVSGTFSGGYQILVHTLLAAELFVSTYVAAHSFRFDRLVALMAAWMTPLLLLPYFHWAFLYPLLMFAPHYATLVSESLLVSAAFAALGRPLESRTATFRRDALLCVAIAALLAHMTFLFPVGPVIWLPLLGVVGAGLLVAADKPGERRRKLIGGAVAYMLWTAIFGVFVLGLFAYSTPVFWHAELQNNRRLWIFVSTWFWPLSQAGKILIATSTVGLLLALANRAFRIIALTMLVLMAGLYGFGTMTVYFDFWNGPSPVYFESFIVPFYAMFASYAVVQTGSIPRAILSRLLPGARTLQLVRASGRLAASVAIPAAALTAALLLDKAPRIYGPAPPTKPPLVANLVDKIAISPGTDFRGRVATLLLQNRTEPAGWHNFISTNAVRVDHTGNDYYWSGLWPFNVPTLFEYSQITSPSFFHTAVTLWARPGDRQIRNVIALRRADAKSLALFGVRYVIADGMLPPPFHLEAEEKTTDTETLYLFDVPDANLGNYSPTVIKTSATFDQALTALSESDFDPTRAVVLFDSAVPTDMHLAPARQVGIQLQKGGFTVRATSSGQSLIVLPFEFSHCLQVTMNLPDALAPSVLRADGPLIALLFTRQLDVRISYLTSPFTRPTCRIQDALAFKRILGR